MKKILFFISLVLLPCSGFASITYSYIGNDFTQVIEEQAGSVPDGLQRMTISFTVDQKLKAGLLDNIIYSQSRTAGVQSNSAGILTFTMSNGVTTIDQNTLNRSAAFRATTDDNGNIISWNFQSFYKATESGENFTLASLHVNTFSNKDNPVTYDKSTFCCGAEGSTGANRAENMNMQGNWVVTPIPAAAWLFGTSLVGLAGIKRKK